MTNCMIVIFSKQLSKPSKPNLNGPLKPSPQKRGYSYAAIFKDAFLNVLL